MFREEKAFLSNFYPSPIVIKSQHFNCVEQFYVWSKCADQADREHVLGLEKAGKMKRYGRKVALVSNWEK